MKRSLSVPAVAVAVAVTVVAVAVVAREVDVVALRTAARAARNDPFAVVTVAAVYGAAFLVRAIAWHRVVPVVPVGQGLAAIHLALVGNHLLPFRLGEALRVTSIVRRAGVDPAVASASTVALRGADLVALAALVVALGAGVVTDVSGAAVGVLVAVAIGLTVAGTLWLRHLRRAGRVRLAPPGPVVAAAVVLAWGLEAVVMWQAAAWAGVALTLPQAVLVTVVTVAAQIAAVAPGGFGTYEAAGTAVLVALGIPAGTALAIAVTAHAIKTAYALVAGGVAAAFPAPSVVGRLRLPRRRPAWPQAPSPTSDAPVVLFLPAHDEEATVADVVARCPETVLGRPVRCVVIDDGSTDATAERAVAAGAEVVRHVRNQGLGAAVRRGFAEGLARGAAVVAFCDADGEYDPAELERLAAPILAGDADYVVGSRFHGEILRMLPHRRLGNLVLTWWTRWVAREAISDGQSGYRALSASAAAIATIEHDFNYAQVLTLDLIGRGARYAEVPITYAFRRQGRSFVRLGRYLRRVVPAVHRTVNRAPA